MTSNIQEIAYVNVLKYIYIYFKEEAYVKIERNRKKNACKNMSEVRPRWLSSITPKKKKKKNLALNLSYFARLSLH